jgi:hypothetical protein
VLNGADLKVQFKCSATKSLKHETTQNINIQLNKFLEDFVVLSFYGDFRLFSKPQLEDLLQKTFIFEKPKKLKL